MSLKKLRLVSLMTLSKLRNVAHLNYYQNWHKISHIFKAEAKGSGPEKKIEKQYTILTSK